MNLGTKEHIPVLLKEVLGAIETMEAYKEKSVIRYLDGTLGRGGHFEAIKEAFPQVQAVAMDQDEEAIVYAQKKFQTEVQNGQLRLIHDNFLNFLKYDLGEFDFILLDLGVSSPQLDKGERGFSFYHDGPLDMRMNQQQDLTAEYVINTSSEEELIRLFKEYGEIYKPYRVVRAIVHDRKTKAFQSTKELAGLIERVDGWRHKGQHPATQYFMALRLVVNAELHVIKEALPQMMKALTPGGRCAVISFHSLEDRIVKNLFRDSKELGKPIHKKVIIASEEESRQNPRSRSAKLRIFERSL